ncbi:uncharacterized protein JN550_012046 [Neoarthrinium moseri]|uniref:uncharacterized protein n=1 Tax=Neoarthrinium moseri TaxID=1658444 RepID=UPI001FDCB7C8|nr:uncharacterized protein JN550_012046 [Neoarthrinium moseri]KAI1859528.1 hypothetical protein JN550_012046 [Neoarthrinium moseri]
MKVLFVAALPLFGFFGTALTSPTVAPATIQGRADASGLLDALITSVKVQTGAINATLAALPAGANITQQDDAGLAIHTALTEMTNVINAAISDVNALGTSTKEKRQLDVLAIAALIAALLVEISATLDAVIAVFGIGALLGYLNPLTGALSALILALTVVIDGLLVVVTALLNTLLIGLSVALAGLSF